MSNGHNEINFSIDYLVDKLKNVHKNIRLDNLKDYKLKKFNPGQAFMSEIVQLKFEWIKPTPLNSVILKIPGIQKMSDDQNTDQGLDFLEMAHTKECEFYQEFANPKIPLKLPKFYFGYPFSRHNKDGLMILEDLSETSRTIRMLPGFSNAQTESVFIELARFYAASLLDRKWLEKLKAEGDMSGFIWESKRMAQLLRKIKPEWFESVLDDLDPAFNLEYYKNCFSSESLFGLPSGIVQGDLWASNVLWKKDDKGNATSELSAIIDWQICASGNPGSDLSRCLGLNTSTKYRHENEDRLLKLYYDTVNKELDGKIPFTLDQLKNAYKQSFPYVATVFGFGAPIYFNMGSVVGEPHDPALQEELLERVYSFFKDTVAIMKEDQ